MYCIYQKEKDGFPVIHIEGKLDSADELKIHLVRIMDSITNLVFDGKAVIKIDLNNVEFISDKCLEVLQDLGSIYHIQFLNYSLYIEILLNEYDLL